MTISSFGLTPDTVDKIRKVFRNHRDIQKVIVYGSRAKGYFKPGSDIDLVIFSDSLSESELLKIEIELDDLLLPYSIDLSLFKNIDDKKVIEHILRVGKVFYSSS